MIDVTNKSLGFFNINGIKLRITIAIPIIVFICITILKSLFYYDFYCLYQQAKTC